MKMAQIITPNEFIRPAQAAKILGCSRETLRNKFKEFGIRRVDYKTHFRYHEGDCREWVKQQNAPAYIENISDEHFQRRLKMAIRQHEKGKC